MRIGMTFKISKTALAQLDFLMKQCWVVSVTKIFSPVTIEIY